jgi:hypothetical protein
MGLPMSKLPPFLAAILGLCCSAAGASPQAVSRTYSADFYLSGCKDFLAGKSDFFSGRCVGAVEVLDALNLDTKMYCPPEATSNLQRVQAIVAYISARPQRQQEDFRLLANEAMAKTWPCKK